MDIRWFLIDVTLSRMFGFPLVVFLYDLRGFTPEGSCLSNLIFSHIWHATLLVHLCPDLAFLEFSIGFVRCMHIVVVHSSGVNSKCVADAPHLTR